MNRIRTSAAGALVAGVALLVPATAASAAVTGAALDTAGTVAATASAADGKLHAWTEPYRRGGHCAWAGNAASWGGCANNVGSVENRGYAGTYDDVNLYWGSSYAGAWACLGRGDMWLDLSIKREKFDHGTTGRGQALYNNIASSKWVTHC